MNTSRIAIFHGTGQPFTLRDEPIPALREGEFLVRNEYTTLCRSDLNTFCGKRTEQTPTILGHEIVGRIEAIGPGAPERDGRGAALRVGDRVTWAIYAADPDSAPARLGIPQKGPDLFKYGHEQVTPDCTLHGGLAEHCILRRHTLVIRIDADIPLPVLALINCSVATVTGSFRLAGPVAGRDLLVAGAGMLGVIACALGRVGGARRIIAVDVDAARLETATRFGADATVQLQPDGAPLADQVAGLLAGELALVALDYSGVPDTMEALLAVLGIGGTLVLVGATFPQRSLQINAERLVRNLHTLRGLHNYNAADFTAAVAFIETHHAAFPFATLVDDRFRLDEVDQAFAHGLTSGAHRVGIRCG